MKARDDLPSKANPVPPTREQIAALAHEIWLEQGSPEGSDIDIWLEAERQLTGHAPANKLRIVDPIPADLGSVDPDSDLALHSARDRELGRFGRQGDQRSPTAFGL